MKAICNRFIILLLIIAFVFVFLYLNGNIGVRKSRIEMEARSTLSIDPNWNSVIATGHDISGVLFFDETRSDYEYAIFARKPNSIGYLFASGGRTGNEVEGVAKYSYRNETVYLSLNKQKVDRAQVDNGDIVEIKLDHTKPFALILSNDIKTIFFYDIAGKMVELF